MLLSWAVPKGPSLDPKTKRLAMHVEDHPFDYGEFEGVIPEGYGAGIVMLWDRGTWTPEVDDVDAALKKGDLKFTLNGYKLKGSWVLVQNERPLSGRAQGGGESRTWLLIKHRDDWAGDLDIAEFAPRSVKSDGDFEDILAADDPAIWHIRTGRPRAATPAQMLATIIDRAAKLKAGRNAKQDHDRSSQRRTKGPRRHEEAPAYKNAKSLRDFVCFVVSWSNRLGSRSRRCDSTLQTAYASRRRSWRAISPVQNSPPTSSQCAGRSPGASGSLCSSA